MTYIDILKSSTLGELHEMSKNCQADYIWIINNNADKNMVLPIKYRKEPNSLQFYFKTKFIGLYILEFLDNTFLVISSNELNLKSMKTKAFRYKYASKFIKSQEIENELEKFNNNNFLQSIESINKITYYVEKSREECILSHGHTNKLESDAHKEFNEILLDNMKLTGECCLADWGFYIKDLSKVIGIQTKTSSIGGDNTFRFYGCDKYDGMLLMCRPMPKIQEGTLIIPGGLVHTDGIGLTVKENKKYYPYLIKDEDLHNFMVSIYESIENNSNIIKWPSGIEVDISSMKFYNFAELMIPRSKLSRIEYENSEWRRKTFPSFIYSTPLIQGTTVDQIINGVKIQDKSARLVGKALQVTLSKSGGKKNISVPYEENDFDCLWIFPNNSRRFIIIIPMFKLIEKGIIKTDTNKGKTAISCYDKEYKRSIRGPKTDLWTQNYYLDTQDADIQDQVINILKTCV